MVMISGAVPELHDGLRAFTAIENSALSSGTDKFGITLTPSNSWRLAIKVNALDC